METVTVKGKVYQIGGLYLNAVHEPCTLVTYEGGVFKTEINEMCFATDKLSEIKTVGIITNAPLELEDGELYWFECEGLGGCSGFYCGARKSFFSCGNKVCGVGQASNIKHMVKANHE